MLLHFTKMQSLGNDFVVLDGVSETINLTPDIAQQLADRHFGIGCDQILLAESGHEAGVDFVFRIFNRDGSEVGQCGNGARCFGRFLKDSGLTRKNTISVSTLTSRMTLQLLDSGAVRVDMGQPSFLPADIPYQAKAESVLYPLALAVQSLQISALSLGNPHAVLMVDDVAAYPVHEIGPLIERHPDFPARVNAGFMEIIDRQHIRLRVFERGVGETLGCGSGACAAVVAGIRLGHLDAEVVVSLPGGDARVAWEGDGHPVYLSGPAHTVFCGKIETH